MEAGLSLEMSCLGGASFQFADWWAWPLCVAFYHHAHTAFEKLNILSVSGVASFLPLGADLRAKRANIGVRGLATGKVLGGHAL